MDRKSLVSRRSAVAGLGAAMLSGPALGQPKRPKVVFETQVTVLFEEEPQAKIWEFRNGNGFTYFAPHNDETSALYAGEEIISRYGGRLLQLRHTGKRNLSFVRGGKTYVFDPNRMFTERGIRMTLQQLGRNYSDEAHALVRGFANIVLGELDLQNLHKGFLIGLHNNTPGNYSIRSYAKGGLYEKEAEDVHINPGIGEDDFFFVTERAMFEKLKAFKHNVALQRIAGVTDDGSMSVYCAQQGIPYANVEAQHGRAALQVKMIQTLISL